ncbi:MAG: GNAT family N-acetyltransferase [Cyanobacteria bacterium PR.023]|nr:GNAT family N-acetyltransferase [Cyanobacteria bacterium PR.023]
MANMQYCSSSNSSREESMTEAETADETKAAVANALNTRIALYDPTQDSLEEITNLLHQAYASLAARGFNYVAATQTTAITESRLTAGKGYIARLTGEAKIIGTVTYYTTARVAPDEPEYYKKRSVGHFGQFAVHPEMQKLGIGSRLVEFVESLARADGKEEMACDTAEGATDLIEYYTSKGYRLIEYHQWDKACYRSVILSKKLG